MPDRYVNPARADDTGDGLSWAAAKKTLLAATADAEAGETIYFATGTADVLTVDTTYTIATGVRIISTSDTTNEPPTTYEAGATVSSTTSGVDVYFSGTFAAYGLTVSLGTGATTHIIGVGNTDGSTQYFEGCAFTLAGSNAGALVLLGTAAAINAECRFLRCDFTWAATGQGFTHNSAKTTFIYCDMSAGAVHPSVLMEVTNSRGGAPVEFVGCDLSNTSTVFTGAPLGPWSGVLRNCKLHATPTIFAPTILAAGDVIAFDCASGDTHINIAHYDYQGSTTVSTSIYANDNIGDADLSWVVAGNENASAANPYMSPWMSVYHSGTSAITPYLECVRSGNSAAYTEAEVWSEWTAKTTASSTQVTLYSNRTGPLATPGNNEASSKTGTDWTGEDVTNNWFGKLQPNSMITPAEAGHISARICVAGNHTVYVDPQIRGRA
jgi:hypothetical protein